MIWVVLIAWYLVGLASIFLSCWLDDDILYTDLPIMLIVSVMGPLILIPLAIQFYEIHRDSGKVFIRGYGKGKD